MAYFRIFCKYTHQRNIFIIGAYHRKTKPVDCNTFLFDFVQKLKVILIDGFIFENYKVNVEIRALICDAPAKSFILNTKGHTRKYHILNNVLLNNCIMWGNGFK